MVLLKFLLNTIKFEIKCKKDTGDMKTDLWLPENA